MYLRILKKDLKRKRTMNTILLIFIMLASMFIASSVNNMLSVTMALGSYFERANVPDYWFSTTNEDTIKRYGDFARRNHYGYGSDQSIQVDVKEIHIDGEPLDYSNTVLLSKTNPDIKVFDSREEEIKEVGTGELYITSKIFWGSSNNFKIGSQVEITVGGVTKTFTVKDYTKDALYGASMIGMTRFLISEEDFGDLLTEDASVLYDGFVYTQDENYYKKFYDEGLIGVFDVDLAQLNMMYVMDLIIAVVILIVSVCLILISMVILRFAIHFTISEDFREIGVMKAIGLPYGDIRRLYMVKYLAISVVGGLVGFFLSIPFGDMLMENVSRNIILSEQNGIFLNFICTVLTAGCVLLFCWRCTKRIKRLSPIDAIRSGQSGERFSRKSILHLGRLGFPPVPFMAVNDILSGIKSFIAMIIIFTLGLLLIIIPVNTINTLQSDQLVTWFSAAECDHVISRELLSLDSDSRRTMEEDQERVRAFLVEKNMPARVFQEEMFRVILTYKDKKTSSFACQGVGDITDEQYVYTEGSAPRNPGEIAVTAMNAEKIGAAIGDDVKITNGDVTKKYTITAFFQSMNNMGEGIRFYHDEELDHDYVAGCFGIQIKYTDAPDSKTLSERKEQLQEAFPEDEVYTAGEYVNDMIGDAAGQLDSVKGLIIFVVLAINILITVLIGKSFIAREKGEIAILKAVGFSGSAIVIWQSMRFGIVILMAVILAILLSSPLSQLTVGPVFQMMGAQSIEFAVKPLEVFVLYPLIVCMVTVAAGTLTALQSRKIRASETANVE